MEELKSEILFEEWDLNKNIFKIEDGELEGGTWPRGGTPKAGHVSHATGMELFLRSIHVIAS